jgi:tripartite motif-containing protein 71
MRLTEKPKEILSSVLLLLLLVIQSVPAFAAGKDRGVMRVNFLYSIEYTGGRSEKLRSPMDIFYDRRSGELYIADAGHGAIFVYDANGVFVARIPVASQEGSPMMIAVDAAGRIYVGHNRSPRISVLDYNGAQLEVLDLPGVAEEGGVNGSRPLHLAAGGPEGRVYALKSRGGLVRIDPEGDVHEEIRIAGTNTEEAPGQIFGFSMDQAGRFLFSAMRPYSVVRYDTDRQTFHRIGTPGVIYGLLARPAGIATDEEGRIFVASTVRHKVLCYDREGEFVEEFGGIGRGYGRFYMPDKIASDSRSRLFVLERILKRVQVFEVEFLSNGQEAGDRLANAGSVQ